MNMGLGGPRELVMDREAWHGVVYGVAKSQIRLSDWTELSGATGELPQFLFNWESLYFLHFWKTAFPGKVFLIDFFFFLSALWMYNPTLPLAFMVSAEESYSFVELHPYVRTFFFLKLLKFLLFDLRHFLIMYVGEDYFGFKLFGYHEYYELGCPYVTLRCRSFQRLFFKNHSTWLLLELQKWANCFL